MAGVLDKVFGNGEERKENRNNRAAKTERIETRNPYEEEELVQLIPPPSSRYREKLVKIEEPKPAPAKKL